MTTPIRAFLALACLALSAQRAGAASFHGDLDTSHHAVADGTLAHHLDAHLARALLAFENASQWAEAGVFGDYSILLPARAFEGRSGVAAVLADTSTSVVGDLLTASHVEWSHD